MRRAGAVALAAAAMAASVAAAAGASGRPDPRAFLVVHPGSRSVRLILEAGLGRSNNGFNFDGYGRGELLVTIPRGWRVSVRCSNHGSLYHSCAVVAGPMTTRLAFRGASTPRPSVGLAPGGSASFGFVAGRAGVFRIACLVPGHEEARMWDVLRVVRHGRPSISARPGP